MPYEISFFQLPCGARGFRMEGSGTFSKEDALATLKLVDPGGELHGLPCVVLTRNVGSISPEARRVYSTRGELDTWMAVVVTNPVIRVTARFLMRIQKARKTGLFATEEKAIQWLDARVRENTTAKAD
jgi:hypothetical protein